LTSSDSHVLIVGLGAATPVGRSVWASAAAVRAGIAGFASHPYMVDEVGLPMRIAPLPWIDPERSVVERIGDALISALREAMVSLEHVRSRPPITLLVNFPPDRPGTPEDLPRLVCARVAEQLPGAFSRVSCALLGHAGAMIAIQSALAMLAARPDSLCLVAGADSYLDPDVLEWLEQTEQLHGAGERNNAWGFVPGEGAGALLLATRHTLDRLELKALGGIRAVGIGRESELIGTGAVCTAVGLTGAVRLALAALNPDEMLSDVYCDMNGEPYRADEYAFLVTRTRERFAAPSEFVAPADCWGDLGAASVPLLIALACIAGAKKYAKGDAALVWASSMSGERGAALLATAPG
jgi:3-oxoacyl-[acyl-carrier-protein] synthase I